MHLEKGRIWALGLTCCLVVFLFNCGDSVTGPQDKGTLKIFLTDSPLHNVQNVYVTLSDIKVHRTSKGEGDAGFFSLTAPAAPIDLLTLQGREELLSSNSLEDGFYTYISLEISAGVVVSDTAGECELEIASGKVLIPVPFTIEQGKVTSVLLDFDAEQSVQVVSTGGANIRYILRPVITPVKVEGPSS